MSLRTHLNIILFWFHDDWGKYGRAYEMIALHLARLPDVNQVVCIFPPKAASSTNPVGLHERRVSPKLSLLTEHLSAMDRVFFRFQERKSDKALINFFSSRGFTSDNTLLWLFPPHPYIDRILKLIPSRFIIAHVIDNFTHFDKSHWLYPYAVEQYPRIGQWSDVIFTSSESNRLAFSAAGVPCHCFPLAVDKSFIATPSELPCRATGASPRLGYLGFIMERTDLHILCDIAAQRPDWEIILAGPEYPKGYIEKSGILKHGNVRWLGEISNDEAPGFLRSLDVCLMPHKDNDYSRSMGPLKLYQYLGSGRPVISTPVAGLDGVKDYVHIANNSDEFVAQAQDALENDSIKNSASRIDAVRHQTWDVRVEQMLLAAIENNKNQH